MGSKGRKWQLAEEPDSASSSPKSLKTGGLGKALCVVQFHIFSALCFMTFLDAEILGFYIWSPTCCTRTNVTPHPHLPFCRTWWWDLQMSDSYYWCYTSYQLLWLENKLPPNSVVLKQHLFHSPICSVDKAHQGPLISAPLGIRWGGFRAGGWIIWILCSLACLASELGELEQLGVGATGHFVMLSHYGYSGLMASPPQDSFGSKVICPLREERGEMRECRGSAHQADAILPLMT